MAEPFQFESTHGENHQTIGGGPRIFRCGGSSEKHNENWAFAFPLVRAVAITLWRLERFRTRWKPVGANKYALKQEPGASVLIQSEPKMLEASRECEMTGDL